ncbi:zinc finger protein 512B isoform X5 [Stegostoma tigrinum]|uniref:zinc finger protein 512B isoform X5 n=1 Tax=Stegostoma tigrinum TaxID=3053191 RepID=UPI00202B0FD2|nr:zinc finger protein 512B isoform X5 [Stegostoma tigrinum]
MKEDMADSSAAGKVRGGKGHNAKGLGDRSKAKSTKVKTSTDGITFGRAESDKVENRQKGRHKSEDQELKEIPGSVMAKWKEEFKMHSRVKCPRSGCWLEFPSIYGLKYHYQRCQSGIVSKKCSHQCLLCEASFTSKSQLEKHKQWTHEEKRTQTTELDEKVTKSVGRGRGRKRAAENAETLPKKSKQQKRELSRHSENGECATQNRENKLPNTADAQESLTSNELSKGKKQVSLPEEDPERTKHRRKQKTPKKFTGEQPSISGTFGLKGKRTQQSGLSKPDDKGRGKGKKKNNSTCNEELQRKPLAVHIKKEAVTYLPGSQEEKWQQEISDRGEVICPNCMTVHRKTVAGLKKHLEICKELQNALKCQHCAKQFKSKAGLKYHTMAEHNNKPLVNAEKLLDEQQERERLRRVLKQMGKLKCPNEATEDSDQKSAEEDFENLFEKTPSGRIRRRSAQVAVFHLQEIAEDELSKLWTKRRNKDDLVPDIKRLKYTRPGLPSFNPKQLESWKNEVKENGQICCPNNRCEAIYSSFSGLKAHLATCTKGEHLVGKYRCLICQKEFSSESGVKYHINNSHSENWFRASAEIPARNKRELKVTKSERKKSTTGKKRGRKPKERTSELSIKDNEMVGAKTADQITSQCPATLKNNSKMKKRKILPSSKKGGSV